MEIATITDLSFPTGRARSFSEQEGEFHMDKIMEPPRFEGERAHQDAGGAENIFLLGGEGINGTGAGGIH